MVDATTSYDVHPYLSLPHAATHPDHLAAIAALLGMQPPEVATCRILELGCASGGNLLPLAASMPRATLVGCDLSSAQIERGRTLARAAGLDNVSLHHRDIAAMDTDGEPFDYIICHGVYSWVPPEVQRQIMSLCRRRLSPQGVAYISYNTYPGWHLRGAAREMMMYHTARVGDPQQRIPQARALLDLLVRGGADANSAYARLLREEQEILRGRDDTYLLHEHLEEYNTPVYFHEFVDRARSAGLQFLAEAQLSEMMPNHFSPEVRQALGRMASDVVSMEQYLDFLHNRKFRRSLLCHGEVPVNRAVAPYMLEAFHFAGQFADVDSPLPLAGRREWVFRHPTEGGVDSVVTLHDPLHAAALARIAQAWPQSIAVSELAAAARRDCATAGYPASASAGDVLAVAELVLRCMLSGVVETTLTPRRFSATVGETPRATALARQQARASDWVTNQTHQTIVIQPFERALLPLLDGTRTRAALRCELAERVLRGELKIEHDGKVLAERQAIDSAMSILVENGLARLASNALLVG